MAETPRVMSEVTAEWLSSVLDCRVASIRVEIIGAGEGFMGQLARVHLTGTGCPSSVIVKMPTADPGGQMIGQMMRVWEREHRFYTEVAPHMHGVRIAECLSRGRDHQDRPVESERCSLPGGGRQTRLHESGGVRRWHPG